MNLSMAGAMFGAAVGDRDRGIAVLAPGVVQWRALLPTDPLGSMTLTLTNVVVGSRYRIERQGDGSLATPTANAEGTAGASTVAITLDYYASGSANNDLKIKVRKATSDPTYKPFETLAMASSVDSISYIAQIPDV
jgi:hypothetical protein